MLRSAMKRFLFYKRILFAGAFMFLQSIKRKIKPNTSVELTIFQFRKCEPATLSKKSLPDISSLP